jgi:Rieske Fe-S protein
MDHRIPRRTAVGVAVMSAACAACTRYGPPAPPEQEPQAAAGEVLGKAKEVPVGGGVVYKDAKVVVTQPATGEFKGYSAVCTHQGCLVAAVVDGTINCDCHGSKFNLDGTVSTGPATTPLPARQVTVNEGGELVLGGAAEEPPAATTTEEVPETTTEVPPEPADPPPPAAGLAATGDIPVGGGKVFENEQVVITQPVAGDFKAFSAVCTHQGCLVGDVSGGTINCACHGSKFGLDGSVANGPASTPLPGRAVKVSGDQISLA